MPFLVRRFQIALLFATVRLGRAETGLWVRGGVGRPFFARFLFQLSQVFVAAPFWRCARLALCCTFLVGPSARPCISRRPVLGRL